MCIRVMQVVDRFFIFYYLSLFLKAVQMRSYVLIKNYIYCKSAISSMCHCILVYVESHCWSLVRPSIKLTEVCAGFVHGYYYLRLLIGL